MDAYKFNVDLKGMINILSEHLYSTPKVFYRELLQNAADAVTLRKESDKSYKNQQITVTIYENQSLSFCDNGTGLTEDEIHRFVSVIGQSSKRGKNSEFIGRFGIGLLSCFIVTDEIILRSRSVKTPDKVIEWHGFSDGNYSVKEIQSDMEPGTEIFISANENSKNLFNVKCAVQTLRYYGLPIPCPIYVSDGNVKIRVNTHFSGSSENEHTRVLDMGKQIFETDYEFLDFIPLNSPTGLFSGAAYILPFTVSAATVNTHRIYLKNMLLTEDGTSILPKWAFFVKVFLNTDKLKPTASRENFFINEDLETAKDQISQCLSDYLEKLSICNNDLLTSIVTLHENALKSVASENDTLFKLFMPYFSFETSFGIVNGNDIMNYRRTIFTASDIYSFKQLRPVLAEKDELLLNMCYAYDKSLISMLSNMKKNKIEEISENLIDSILENCPSPEKYENMLQVFSDSLMEFDCRAVIKDFGLSHLPSLFCINNDGKLKKDIQTARENSNELFSDILESFEEEIDEDVSSVLYINSKNDLINKIAEINDYTKLNTFAQILYVQALISGGYPVYNKEMNILNENLISLIEWGL